MYAITGITGNVGGEMGRALLAAGQPLRAVVRDQVKGAAWAAQGCDVAVADLEDAAQLAASFAGTDGVFIVPPPAFDPTPGYPEARRAIDAVVSALRAARPGKVLCLSTIGADAVHDNLLTQRTLMEDALRTLPLPVTFLRPAWFMENALWDVASARDEGILRSFLQPVDKAFPMVAARDVGRVAARLMQQDWSRENAAGPRVVELEGPARVSPADLARAFARALGHPVHVDVVPRAAWETLFRAQGMENPVPRMRMLDGFNEGWIEFRDGGRHAMKGETTVTDVIAALVAQAARTAA